MVGARAGEWSSWGKCDQDTGQATRERESEELGWQEETKECQTGQVPKLPYLPWHCNLLLVQEEWGEWGDCLDGIRVRLSEWGGLQEERCEEGGGDWSDWGDCENGLQVCIAINYLFVLN